MDLVSVLKTDTEGGVGENFDYGSFDFDRLFCQKRASYRGKGEGASAEPRDATPAAQGNWAAMNFTPGEERLLKERLDGGEPLLCPRCLSAMVRRDVRPRSDVSYVRDRVWLMCERCRRTAVLERK